MPDKREISPLLALIRNILLHKTYVNPHRFEGEISKRTQPPPNLPGGVHAKLSNNYYFTRDARGLVKPETVLVDQTEVLKLSGKLSGGSKTATAVGRVPGKVTNWDI